MISIQKRHIFTILLILTLSVTDVVSKAETLSSNRLRETFSTSIDSLKCCIIWNDWDKIKYWSNEAYRTICDSDTYYAYKAIDAYIKLTETSLPLCTESKAIQKSIDYFADRTDSFSLNILSVAHCAMGKYLYTIDVDRAVSYYDKSRMYSSQIGAEVFSAYTVLMAAEAYEKENMHVEAAVLARRILDSNLGKQEPILRFLSLLQLYKIYTQMRANSMVDFFADIIEKDGFYLNDLSFETDYIFFKANYYIYTNRYEEALECSHRLMQIVELVGNVPKVWRVNMQAAKIHYYLDNLTEAKRYIDICKKSDVYTRKIIFNSLYSSYHVDVYEAMILIKQNQFSEARAILQHSNPPEKLYNMLEFGTCYYHAFEDVYLSMGDYHNAAEMERLINKLHVRKYAQHAKQRSGDIDNMFQSDTTIINQDAMLARQNYNISSARNKLILWALITIVIIVISILIRMLIIRYRRNEREKIDIEQRKRLEHEVERQTKQLVIQKNEISNRNSDILMSQSYARIIQEGVLLDISKFAYPEFKGSFIIYKTADVVSSNLYWFRRFNQYIVVCCADCLEHGVPGAMITLVGLTILNDITQHCQSYVASEIIDKFDTSLAHMIPDINRRNSMSMSVAIVDTTKQRLNIAASNSKVIMYIAGKQHVIVGDKCYLGVVSDYEEPKKFTDTYVNYTSGDSVYLFTNGVDMLVGGALGEKLTEKRFIEIIDKSTNIPIAERGIRIEQWLKEWTRDATQTDDCSIVGFELL